MISRCVHCGDVIGAYEPTIVIGDGRPRRTSRAAELEVIWTGADCYHDACYRQAHGEPPGPAQPDTTPY
ncbi:MAG TPA: hypothetical protein VK272_14235 [Solirubrobacteraceae bacterium]|nr:hypothetical protein [Solirubrobacteraceae bacterium]